MIDGVPPQKSSEKAVKAYAALPVEDRAAISESPKVKAYLSRYEQMDKQRADEEAQKRADDTQRIKDKKNARIHDFAVAAFSVALTLFLEHIVDFVDFIKSLF